MYLMVSGGIMMTFVILVIILAIDDRFLASSILYLVSFLALAMFAVFIWGSVVIIGKLNSGRGEKKCTNGFKSRGNILDQSASKC